MCVRHSLAKFAVAALVLSFCVSHSVAQDFSILLTRKVKAGDQYGVTGIGHSQQLMNMSVNGQAMPAKQEEMNVEFVAAAKIIEATPNGREKRTSFTISKATKTVKGMVSELLPAGTVLVAEQVGIKTQFSVDGQALAADVAKAIDLIVSMESDEGANDDIVFGTKERKKVGDSWPVNAKAAAEDVTSKTDGAMKLTEKSISGTTTLVEIAKAKTGDALRVEATMKLTDITIDLPPGMKVESSRFDAHMKGLFPVDPAKRALSKSMAMQGEFVCGGMVGERAMTMTMTMKQSTDITFTVP